VREAGQERASGKYCVPEPPGRCRWKSWANNNTPARQEEKRHPRPWHNASSTQTRMGRCRRAGGVFSRQQEEASFANGHRFARLVARAARAKQCATLGSGSGSLSSRFSEQREPSTRFPQRSGDGDALWDKLAGSLDLALTGLGSTHHAPAGAPSIHCILPQPTPANARALRLNYNTRCSAR
jgi:hypothetical protein